MRDPHPRNAQLSGAIKAGKVIIEGKVEGPIEDGNVVLKSRAHVVGDIHPPIARDL